MAAPYMCSRTKLYPGAWTYVWNYDGAMTADPTTNPWQIGQAPPPGTDPVETVSLALRSIEEYDRYYHQALRIPDVPLGTGYKLYYNNQSTGIEFDIEAAPDSTIPATNVIDPSVSDPVAAIEAALGTGNGNVALKGGTYVLNAPINVPANRLIRGYGATLVRAYNPALYVTPVFNFTGDGHVTVEGVTFVADRRPASTPGNIGTVALADNLGGANRTNVTVRRCVFRNVSLGEWTKPGFFAEDCVWDEGGGCQQVTGPALFLRCMFRGLADPSSNHAWSTWTGSGMALLDCDFLGTDRGPVFNGFRGTIEYNLVSGVQCDRLAYVDNGCEGIVIEGQNFPVRNRLCFHLRYRGESHGIIMWKVNSSGHIFRDFVLDGGYGITLGGGVGMQEANQFYDGEVRGGILSLQAGGAINNIMQNVTFIGPRPTRGSRFTGFTPQITSQKVLTNLGENPGIDYVGPGPGSTSVRVGRLLDGWTET